MKIKRFLSPWLQQNTRGTLYKSTSYLINYIVNEFMKGKGMCQDWINSSLPSQACCYITLCLLCGWMPTSRQLTVSHVVAQLVAQQCSIVWQTFHWVLTGAANPWIILSNLFINRIHFGLFEFSNKKTKFLMQEIVVCSC